VEHRYRAEIDVPGAPAPPSGSMRIEGVTLLQWIGRERKFKKIWESKHEFKESLLRDFQNHVLDTGDMGGIQAAGAAVSSVSGIGLLTLPDASFVSQVVGLIGIGANMPLHWWSTREDYFCQSFTMLRAYF
jgi:hypothetical protein